MHEEADQGSDNDVSVDIRSGYPGGEWPIHGVFRLRSFHNVLNFIGQSISDDPEYVVAKHPQTPNVSQNPVNTMAVLVSDDRPADSAISASGLAIGITRLNRKPVTHGIVKPSGC